MCRKVDVFEGIFELLRGKPALIFFVFLRGHLLANRHVFEEFFLLFKQLLSSLGAFRD